MIINSAISGLSHGKAKRELMEDRLFADAAKTSMSCGILPMEYNVLVRPDVVEEKTAGGLYIPEDKKEKDEFAQTMGTLTAVSPMAFTFSDWPDGARKPQVGDRVIFSRYQATEVKGQDGEKYWLMKDKSIAGVMK